MFQSVTILPLSYHETRHKRLPTTRRFRWESAYDERDDDLIHGDISEYFLESASIIYAGCGHCHNL